MIDISKLFHLKINAFIYLYFKYMEPILLYYYKDLILSLVYSVPQSKMAALTSYGSQHRMMVAKAMVLQFSKICCKISFSTTRALTLGSPTKKNG